MSSPSGGCECVKMEVGNTHVHTHPLTDNNARDPREEEEERHRMVRIWFVICSLDATGMSLGNGSLSLNHTIKPSRI